MLNIRLLQLTLFATVATAVALVGCQTQATRPNVNAAQTHNADDLFVVDCLLPGQVRKLGQQLTFLAPRRAIKTSGVDCEIRGGEYVAFDRANYATALRIWLPPAKQGDPQAQVYVGEIYEKGLGVGADYQLAAAWYRKAAAQGNARAQIDLGYLYESGLGVDRDIAQALNWYRQASGLTGGELEYVSSVEMAERTAARQELTDLRSEVGKLRDDVRRAEDRLTDSRQSLAATQQRADALRHQLAAAQDAEPTAGVSEQAPDPQLQRRLDQAQAENQQLAQQLTAQEGESEQLRDALNQSESALLSKREQLKATEAALGGIREQLAEARALPATQPVPTTRLASRVDEQRRLLGEQRNEISRLTGRVATAEVANADLQRELAQRDQQVSKIRQNLDRMTRDNAELSAVRRQLEVSQNERRRLVEELARVQLETGTVQQRLEQTEATLQSRQKDSTTLELALAELKQRLTTQQTASQTSASAATARLQEAIEHRETQLAAARQEVTKLQRAAAQQRADAAAKIGAATHTEKELRDTLASRDAEIDELNEKLAATATAHTELRGVQAQLTQAEAERTRLAEQLAKQQLTAATLQQRLATSEQTAADHAAQLENAQQALQLLQSELASRTGDLSAQAAQIEELESQLQRKNAALTRQRKELQELETKHLRNRASLEVKLVDARRRQSALAQEASAGRARIEDLNRRLVSTQADLAASENKAGKLATIEQQLHAEREKVANSETQIQALRQELARKEAALQGPDITSVVETKATGPVIEIIDPPLAATRAKPSVLLRSPARTVELIGRVRPKGQLLSFKINQAPHTLTKNGLFKETLTLQRPDTPVHMVAVDRLGRRTALDFIVVPPAKSGVQVADAAVPRSTASSIVPQVDFGRYHALIIGNQNYAKLPNLKTPHNDARQLQRVLQTHYGFTTKLVLDATRYELLSALNEMRATLTERDNLLVFYAGHGELDSVNLRGHWLPVDAEPDSSANWISNIAITDILNAMAAKHVLVIADSCYSGAMTRSSVARLETGLVPAAKADWYRIMTGARARTVLTSGGLEPVLDSGGGGNHSIFTAALLQVLQSNEQILEGYSLFRRVQKLVKQQAAKFNIEQDPQYAPIKYAGHEAGEFFFLPHNGSSSSQLGETKGSEIHFAAR